jgi:hypothetical protein
MLDENASEKVFRAALFSLELNRKNDASLSVFLCNCQFYAVDGEILERFE